MPPNRKSQVERMRQRRAEVRANPEAHAAYKQKERERYIRRKEAGKIQNINNMTPREQRKLRRKWKVEKRILRQKNKSNSNQTPEEMDMVTPLDSPETQDQVPVPVPSHQKSAGRKKIRRENRKAYRTINEQKKTIKKLDTEVKQLKLKIRSLKRKTETSTSSDMDKEKTKQQVLVTTECSPASRAKALLESGDKDKVKRQLTYGFTVSDEIKQKLQASLKRHRDKQAVHRLLSGKLLRKYRLIEKAKQEMKLTKWELKKAAENALGVVSLLDYKRKKTEREKDLIVKSFFLQDVNSTPSAGKRETITRNKVKVQKRYLCDTMLNLYEKFKAENPTETISYTAFTRLRPFYVVTPAVSQRDTVKCKKHHNCELKAIRLHTLGVLVSKVPYELMKKIACSVHDKNCMYRNCKHCSKLDSIYKHKDWKASSETIRYQEWQNMYEERTSTQGKAISVKVVKKIEKEASVPELCRLFERELSELMPHQFRIFHQFSAIKDIKQKLSTDDCVLQVDFSENYGCKVETEIQAMHFGASRKQISLHTCHATLKDSVKCYCTVSEDIRHTAESVWAHLTPVLDDLSNNGIKNIHFVSDGPTTQYRNKTNFHLFATLPFTKWRFQRVTYNFLEAGHGKGPADGIGAAVKNEADRLVAHGKDVLGSRDIIDFLGKQINVELYEVTTEQIDAVENQIQDLKLRTVKGTMKIHQMSTSIVNQGTIFHRELSCFCNLADNAGFCDCHSRGKFQVQLKRNTTLMQIEKQLCRDTVLKFEKRLMEGYDVTIEDLNALDMDTRQEYIYWQVWKAARLQPVVDDTNTEETFESSESEWEMSANEEEEIKSVTVRHTSAEHSGEPELHGYYAVFFFARGSKKGTFYIGRVVRTDGQRTDLKFLERKSGSGSTTQYDWPRRDDISTIDTAYILSKVEFTGPPPFALNNTQYKNLQELVQKFSNKQAK